jgi:hypothetical protein
MFFPNELFLRSSLKKTIWGRRWFLVCAKFGPSSLSKLSRDKKKGQEMFFGERRNWDFPQGPWIHFHRENILEIKRP